MRLEILNYRKGEYLAAKAIGGTDATDDELEDAGLELAKGQNIAVRHAKARVTRGQDILVEVYNRALFADAQCAQNDVRR